MSNNSKKTEISITRGKRLRFIRDMTGMKIRPFSEQCGVGYTTISYWENGSNILSERGAQKIVRAMKDVGINCTMLWLLTGKGEPPTVENTTKLPKFNYNLVSPPSIQPVQEGLPHWKTSPLQEEIVVFKKQDVDALVQGIVDESMSPVYQPGDWVGGFHLDKKQLELANGKHCIVKFQTGEQIVRKVKVHGLQSDSLSFYVTNAEYSLEYPPIQDVPSKVITAVAPIVRVWKETVL